jgi:hypothetical protein
MAYTTLPRAKHKSYLSTAQTKVTDTAKSCKLFEQSAPYQKQAIDLNTDELVEQCLALVKAIIIIEHLGIREALIFILEEKLIELRNHFQ